MKLYQVVGILVILNLAFSDCYGYPSLDKARKMKIRDAIRTGMATKDVAGQQSGRKIAGGIYAKKERYSIVIRTI